MADLEREVADLEAATNELLDERVAELEAAMTRLESLVGGLRRQQSATAILVTQMAIHIDRIHTWTAWLQRVYHWMNNAARRNFPWE